MSLAQGQSVAALVDVLSFLNNKIFVCHSWLEIKWIRLPERRLLLNFSNLGTWHLNLAWGTEITGLVLKDAEPGQALHLNRLSTLKIWLLILMPRYGFLGLITNLCISNVCPLFSLLSMQTEQPPNYFFFFLLYSWKELAEKTWSSVSYYREIGIFDKCHFM